MSKIKAVILDLDQTITTDQASWLQFTQLLGADSKIHTNIFERFKSGEYSYPLAKAKLIELWKSAHQLDRKGISEIFTNIKLRPGVFEAIEYLKLKYKLCVISGAINVFVDVIANKLLITDRFAATKFIFDENNILVDFEYKLSRGEEKLEFLKLFCEKYNYKFEECAAIGDGESDQPIFDVVGLPILFLAEETSVNQKNLIQTHLSNWRNIKLIGL
jgi:phosphoserine phosphatase